MNPPPQAPLICTRSAEIVSLGLGLTDQRAHCERCQHEVCVRDEVVRGLPEGDYPVLCSVCARALGWNPRPLGNRAERRQRLLRAGSN